MGPYGIPWKFWLEVVLPNVLLAIGAALLITLWAWKGNVAVFRSWKLWWQQRPERRRYRTDPQYRRQVDTVAAYTEVFMQMHLWHGAASAYPDSRWRSEKFMAAREAAAAFLAGLDEEGQGFIAEHMRENLFENQVPLEDLRAWFAEEVENAKYAPFQVAGHAKRCANRFYAALGLEEPPEEDSVSGPAPDQVPK